MGGRGSASGTSAKGIEYGTEYSTLLQVGNIKFITRNEGGQTAPLETMSAAENRIYVTVNKFNQIKAITQYDENGMRVNEIHLHPHGGMSPHSHPGYDYAHERLTQHLTPSEKRLVTKVLKEWEEYLNGKR